MRRHALCGSRAQILSKFEASVCVLEESVQLTIEEAEIRFVAARRTFPCRFRFQGATGRKSDAATCV